MINSTYSQQAFGSMSGDVVNGTFYLASALWYIDSFVLRNLPLRQAPNR
jgi:hypothetical protein